MNHPLDKRLVLTALAGLAAASGAGAQQPTDLMFSVDHQGPVMGQIASGSTLPITDADVLVRSSNAISPGQAPRIARPADFLAAYMACSGHAAGIPCGLEINAMSNGRDARLQQDPSFRFTTYVSVDEFAVGRPLPTQAPTIFSEALQMEAAADIFARDLFGPGPFGLNPGLSVGVADGNGMAAGPGQSAFPGLGITEPLPQTPDGFDTGDNVDAIDIGAVPDPTFEPFYFSLEGGFPRCQEPAALSFNAAANQPTAGGAVASSADVLVWNPVATTIERYAVAQQLGLDRTGFGIDDVDAVVIWDNGDGVYQPPLFPYSWLGATPTDLLMYSVRCGSDIIGTPDGSFGVPITEGDVLIHYLGDTRPSIFIAAEALGLETVSRGGMFDDELDALDFRMAIEEPFKDCNMNGIEDSEDIATNNSDDCDGNGIPDECEDEWSTFCECTMPANSPCGNTGGAGEGCRNVAGTGGKLEGMGTTSVFSDALQLSLSQLTPNGFAVPFVGDLLSATGSLVGNGRVCVGAGMSMGSGLVRLGVEPTGPGGSFVFGPGIIANATANPMMPAITIGSTWGFQCFYRDIGGPCMGPSNMTNALAVTFTP